MKYWIYHAKNRFLIDSNSGQYQVFSFFFGLVHHTFYEAFAFARVFVVLCAVALSRVVCVACAHLSRVFI